MALHWKSRFAELHHSVGPSNQALFLSSTAKIQPFQQPQPWQPSWHPSSPLYLTSVAPSLQSSVLHL